MFIGVSHADPRALIRQFTRGPFAFAMFEFFLVQACALRGCYCLSVICRSTEWKDCFAAVA